MNQEETFSSSTTAHGDLPEECSPQCCNGPAASRDEIARILREASQTDVNNSGRRFVSRQALLDALDAQKTLRLLNAWSRGNIEDSAWVEEAAAYISPEPGGCSCCDGPERCTGARIIFAMLSLSALEETARFISKSDICDADLPFTVCGKRLKPRNDKSCDLLNEMEKWTTEKKRLFCHFQWAFLTPFFERKAPPHIEIKEFPTEVCLPWLEDEKDPWKLLLGTGGSYTSIYGQEKTIIRKIKISRQFHNFDTPNEYFALKNSLQGTFDKEVEANKRIKGSHTHIVPLLAAFQHAGLNYMLFPWAESGSLDLFWVEYSEPPERNASRDLHWRTTGWLWEQCSGLASALSFIHGYSSPEGVDKPQWHADIQPKNILCFQTLDRVGRTTYTLRISDFEFAEGHKSPTEEVWVMCPPLHPVYYPPELRTDDERKAKVTFKRDVWSLACVYLELLSWFALGYEEGIETFTSDREETVKRLGEISEVAFFRQVPPSFWARIFSFPKKVTMTMSTVVSPPVREKISSLKDWWCQEKQRRRDENRIWSYESLVEELVGFIEDHMLVVDVDRRATSESVHRFFNE